MCSLRIYGLRIHSLQIYSLRIHNLQIYSLQIYSLQIYGLWIRDLNNRSDLVCILVYRGVIVYSLRVGCILANRVNSEAAQIYRINLVKQIRYKAGDPIKFKRSKGSVKFGIIQYLFFSLFCWVFLIQYIIQGPCNGDLFVFFNLYTVVTEEGLQVTNNYKAVSLKNSFYKVCKVFLILLPYVIIYRLKVSIFKDFELNIVVNIIYKYNIDSLFPLLLTFADLLTYICHTMQYSIMRGG